MTALKIGLSLDEYLGMHFEPECELIAGETRPKPMPTRGHANAASEVYLILRQRFGRGRAFEELSIRREDEVLIPDVCLLRGDNARWYRDILDEPPLLCVEVVSPSQRPSELLAKCEIYHDWGVDYCWVVDPVAERAWEYHRGGSPTDVAAQLTGPVSIPLAQVFGKAPADPA